MAPLVQADYHSAEEPNRYSLRALKRSAKFVSHASHADASNINRKEDFLRCLGLQMKTFECVYDASDGVHDNKTQNNTNGLKLRNCSVVVLGVTCKICGKCFKCETDVNVHVALKHSEFSEKKETQFIQGDSDACQQLFESPQYETIGKKSSRTKLRLILRIGDEIVTEINLKRKHLKLKKLINIATQTEPSNVTELITGNNVGRSIDHSVFDNSPCQCCTATVRTVTGTNQYVASNIVASGRTESEESVGGDQNCCVERITTPILETNNVATPNSTSFESDSTNTTGTDLVSRYDRETMCPQQENNSTESYRNKCDSCRSTTDATQKIVDTVSVTFQSLSKDVNANETVRNRNEKLLYSSDVIKTVKVIMPVIFPVIMPNQTSSKRPENYSLSSSEDHLSKTSLVDEQNSDDEVQEVLRIVRGYDNIAREINHESPNRLEQEILARDAIRNMLRLEQQGWHLLEKSGNELVKKRKRIGGKFDAKNVGDETAKKKMKIVGSENIVIRSMNERSGSKESFVKTQKTGQDKMSIAENAKENVLMCNGNINISTETLLHHYGMNYYSDVCEINNNTETTVQQPVSSLLANRPTVIDLANDTQE